MGSLASGYEGLTCFSTGSSYHGAAACKTLLFQNIVEEAKHEGGQLASVTWLIPWYPMNLLWAAVGIPRRYVNVVSQILGRRKARASL